MSDLIYVHIDTMSNAVLTQGITTKDFHQGIVHQPKNLLLLQPNCELGEFEPHTALRVVRGTDAVERYFHTANRVRYPDDNKWIDFSDLTMLKELSPLEISELLYFGHMKTHLHSPFFYKLQNNFVFFDLKDNVARTYYRYLDEFYRILSGRLTHLTGETLHSRRRFFQKKPSIERMNFELMKSLRDVMREGVVFSMQLSKTTNGICQIPIFMVGDTRFHLSTSSLKDEDLIGYLSYSSDTKKWSAEIDEDHLAFAALPPTFH